MKTTISSDIDDDDDDLLVKMILIVIILIMMELIQINLLFNDYYPAFITTKTTQCDCFTPDLTGIFFFFNWIMNDKSLELF